MTEISRETAQTACAIACKNCGNAMLFGPLGIYGCTVCPQKLAAEPLSHTSTPIREPDPEHPHFMLGLTERWYELDIIAAVSLSWLSMAFAIRYLCGWSAAWGLSGFLVAIFTWLTWPSDTTRALIAATLLFTCTVSAIWLLIARYLRPPPQAAHE